MLLATSTAAIALIVLGAILVIAGGAALVARGHSTERRADIPSGMRPGPSDSALETPLLQKLMGWGVILVAFFVIWIPYTWLREPAENLRQEEALKTEAIERGHRAVLLFSEENQLGVGCVRCHGPELRGMPIQVGDTVVRSADLTTLCGGNLINPGHPSITSVEDIYQVLNQGRGAMPSWSIRYQGALDDQQINDLVNYLVAMSSENVPFEDNVCLNPDASKRAVELAATNGTVLERP
jgi:mono/diheme cytochrome c family protein